MNTCVSKVYLAKSLYLKFSNISWIKLRNNRFKIVALKILQNYDHDNYSHFYDPYSIKLQISFYSRNIWQLLANIYYHVKIIFLCFKVTAWKMIFNLFFIYIKSDVLLRRNCRMGITPILLRLWTFHANPSYFSIFTEQRKTV